MLKILFKKRNHPAVFSNVSQNVYFDVRQLEMQKQDVFQKVTSSAFPDFSAIAQPEIDTYTYWFSIVYTCSSWRTAQCDMFHGGMISKFWGL